MKTFELSESALNWLKNGEKGVSSETMFGAITGLEIQSRRSHPSDPDDFKRCMKLINAVPEWNNELYKVAALSDTWNNIINNWETLCLMMEDTLKEWYSDPPKDGSKKKFEASKKQYDFMESLGC